MESVKAGGETVPEVLVLHKSKDEMSDILEEKGDAEGDDDDDDDDDESEYRRYVQRRRREKKRRKRIEAELLRREERRKARYRRNLYSDTDSDDDISMYSDGSLSWDGKCFSGPDMRCCGMTF